MAEDMDSLRRGLQDSLPETIRAALDFYRRFTADAPPADAKGFAAWHAAAKAALAHVEGLVKLARWAEGGSAEEGEPSIEAMLAQARAALGDDDGEDEE